MTINKIIIPKWRHNVVGFSGNEHSSISFIKNWHFSIAIWRLYFANFARTSIINSNNQNKFDMMLGYLFSKKSRHQPCRLEQYFGRVLIIGIDIDNFCNKKHWSVAPREAFNTNICWIRVEFSYFGMG